MNKNTFAPVLASIIAALLISGCAYEGGHHDGYVAIDSDYDGFYDDAYGPINDGYWGPDGAFYYSNGPGHPFQRDDAHHVRHDAASGFHTLHGHHSGPAGGAGHDHG
jgi:hypothetical protein